MQVSARRLRGAGAHRDRPPARPADVARRDRRPPTDPAPLPGGGAQPARQGRPGEVIGSARRLHADSTGGVDHRRRRRPLRRRPLTLVASQRPERVVYTGASAGLAGSGSGCGPPCAACWRRSRSPTSCRSSRTASARLDDPAAWLPRHAVLNIPRWVGFTQRGYVQDRGSGVGRRPSSMFPGTPGLDVPCLAQRPGLRRTGPSSWRRQHPGRCQPTSTPVWRSKPGGRPARRALRPGPSLEERSSWSTVTRGDAVRQPVDLDASVGGMDVDRASQSRSPDGWCSSPRSGCNWGNTSQRRRGTSGRKPRSAHDQQRWGRRPGLR